MASTAMDFSHDYQGEEDSDEYIRPEDFVSFVLNFNHLGYILADLIETQEAAASTADITTSAGDVGASELAEALETVEAPSDGNDCSICLQDDDTAAWKETPCGHRFHGQCVERWLHAKGTCPLCRNQVVTMPTAAATSSALEVEPMAILELYRQVIIANSASMEEE